MNLKLFKITLYDIKNILLRVCDPIMHSLKNIQNILCELFFQLKIDICIYNALITLKLSSINLYDITKTFSEGFVTQL